MLVFGLDWNIYAIILLNIHKFYPEICGSQRMDITEEE